MKTVDKSEIRESLLKAGVGVGQVVFVYSDLGKIGKVSEVKSRDEFCQVYFDCIFEILGSEGTLVVPSYTTQIARFDLDFIHEETPSLMGLFSEFVRHHPDGIRSLHPINSVCAVGKYGGFICSNNGTNNYGWDSPFHRMLLKKAKILCLGLESGYVVGVGRSRRIIRIGGGWGRCARKVGENLPADQRSAVRAKDLLLGGRC